MVSGKFSGPREDEATRSLPRLTIHRLYPPVSYLGSNTRYIIGVHCGTESLVDGRSYGVPKWSENRVWPMMNNEKSRNI